MIISAATIRNKLRMEDTAFFLAALLIMTVPLKWLLASAMAAIIHELGHICAVRLCNGSIRDVEIRPHGICIYSMPMKPIHSILCIAAGPMMSFSLLLLMRFIPRIALCGFAQGAFNLLPIMPLDGGRLLREITDLFCTSEKGTQICRIIEFFTLTELGIMILIAAIAWKGCRFAVLFYLVFLYNRVKRPCKESKIRVQ